MALGALRTYDIAPDGVRVVIDWDKFVVGTSMFIPCINTTLAVRELTKITSDRSQQIISKIIIEKGCLGVRIWRTM